LGNYYVLWACNKLFWRVDKVLELTYKQFLKDYYIIKQNYSIKPLLAEIQGKCDKVKKYFAVWDDKECLEFSPVMLAILIWLAISGGIATRWKIIPLHYPATTGACDTIKSLTV
jgi:hypothetical protein